MKVLHMHYIWRHLVLAIDELFITVAWATAEGIPVALKRWMMLRPNRPEIPVAAIERVLIAAGIPSPILLLLLQQMESVLGHLADGR